MRNAANKGQVEKEVNDKIVEFANRGFRALGVSISHSMVKCNCLSVSNYDLYPICTGPLTLARSPSLVPLNSILKRHLPCKKPCKFRFLRFGSVRIFAMNSQFLHTSPPSRPHLSLFPIATLLHKAHSCHELSFEGECVWCSLETVTGRWSACSRCSTPLVTTPSTPLRSA